MNEKSAQFILAAVSIGCNKDIPRRTLEVVKEADLLVVEQDRPARQVLKEAGVFRDYLRFNEHRDNFVLEEFQTALTLGKKVVYISDQGMPNVEDPGSELLEIAYNLGVTIKVIPGPSSITAALSACPFDCSTFKYLGLLPREEHQRVEVLEKSKGDNLVILDAPYRLNQLISSCEKIFDSRKRSFIALDISGEYEDYLLGSFKELKQKIQKLEKKVNFVLIIER